MTPDLCVEPSLRVLHHVLSTATNRASAAMCRWTKGIVTLTLDEVNEVPLEAVLDLLEVGDEIVTSVVLTFDGNESGQLILMFDEDNGRRLAASLLEREVAVEAEWTELETSALGETGNILAGAYVNALNKLVDVELVPSVPHFLRDFGAAVVQQAIVSQAPRTGQVLISNTRFHRGGEELNWNVLFVPSDELRTKLAAAAEIIE